MVTLILAEDMHKVSEWLIEMCSVCMNTELVPMEQILAPINSVTRSRVVLRNAGQLSIT